MIDLQILCKKTCCNSLRSIVLNKETKFSTCERVYEFQSLFFSKNLFVVKNTYVLRNAAITRKRLAQQFGSSDKFLTFIRQIFAIRKKVDGSNICVRPNAL